MASKIQVRRGLKQDLPFLDNGEIGLAQDTEEVFMGLGYKNIRVAKLEEVVHYPILDLEVGKVTDIKKPYGHVERYGADPTGVGDSSDAIQTAIDLMDTWATGIGTYPNGFFPVTFGSGDYKITRTILIKYDPAKTQPSRPTTLKGVPRKKVGDNIGKGTNIRPVIANHDGKTYANAFAINDKYNSATDEDDVTVFGGGTNAPIADNIMFEDITFKLDGTDIDTYNICAIKAYRTRLTLRNIIFDGMWRGLWQPGADRLGGASYCDFSEYSDINIKRIKYIAMELYTADNVSIRRVTHHHVKSTMDCILKITNGAGITINNFQSAFHGDYDTVNERLVPRNDGTGSFGSKAYIKLQNVYGLSIDGVYIERPLFDYMFLLSDCTNISVNNYYERFFGNGFMRLVGKCRNIKVENVYRFSNLVAEYLDFMVDEGAILQSMKIKNYIGRDWYNETVSIASTPEQLIALTTIGSGTYKARDIKQNFTYGQVNQLDGEEMSFKITYDGVNWIVKDRNDVDITTHLGTLTWATDGLDFSSSKLKPLRIKGISEGYISSTQLPHIPVFRGIGTDKIRFFDRTTGQAISTPDTKCCVYVTINSVFNLTKLP